MSCSSLQFRLRGRVGAIMCGERGPCHRIGGRTPERKGTIAMIEDPDRCVVRIRDGERIRGVLAEALDPVDPQSLHEYVLPANADVELHYHDFDEYWLFTEGTTTVTLRMPDGTRKEYEIGPYDLIATPEGVEHGHIPNETVRGLQFVSKIRPGARRGHIYR